MIILVLAMIVIDLLVFFSYYIDYFTNVPFLRSLLHFDFILLCNFWLSVSFYICLDFAKLKFFSDGVDFSFSVICRE